MAAVDISPDHNNARLLATRDFLDLGTLNGKVRIYTGTRPAPGAAANAANLLVEITLDKPSGSIVSNQLSLTSATAGIATATGAPTWSRWVNGNGAWAIDTDASGPSGSAPVIVSDDTILAGGSISLLSALLG
ncbi:MAG: hypothetical protein ACK5OQ_16360 [Burkholderiales bacterium]|jgi:hypothetical protein